MLRTHDEYLSQRRFDYLDGLRGVAILLVFTAHMQYQDFWYFLHGGSGVTLFFVISGFIITTLLLREWDRDGRVSLKGFYIRRIFRIYPLYFLVLAVYCVLILVVGFDAARRESFTEALPFFIFGFPEIVQLTAGEGVPFSLSWSIGIEEKFYLVWPVLGFVLLARNWRGRMIALGVGFVLFTAAGFTPLNRVLQPYSIIVLGCVIALLLHRRETYDRVSWLGRPVVLASLFVLTIASLLATSWVTLGNPLYVPFGILIALTLVGVMTTKPNFLVKWLGSRPMLFLGMVSYGFYLTHGFSLNLTERLIPGTDSLLGSTIAGAIALPIAILVAWVLHRTVEKPLIRLGHRVAHSNTAPRTVPPDHEPPVREAE